MTHGLTVAEAMLRHPTVHRAGLTVAEARAAFRASPKTHLLLLVEGPRLVTAVSREDVEPPARADEPAAGVGTLSGRTVAPEMLRDQVARTMAGEGRRRLAVVDPSMNLLGLLCLKSSQDGFCTDEGVARMRAARNAGACSQPGPDPASQQNGRAASRGRPRTS